MIAAFAPELTEPNHALPFRDPSCAPPGFSEALKHGRTMRFRYDKRLASGGSDLFQYLSNIGVTVFREPSHLLNGLFENFGHGHARIINCD